MRRAILVAGLLLLPSRALAAQFVVTEVTYEHSTTTTTDSHYRVVPSAETPKNWKAPTDYATAGSVYVRLEVFTKPSAENTRFQICFEASPSYACTNQSPVYTKTGVYTWATPFPSFYQYDKVDWTKGVAKVALILKDDKNVKPAPENVGATRAAQFMPTKLRVTVTVVSPGSTYVPPTTGSDAGADATIDAAPDSMTAEDATVEDSAEPTDAGSPVEDAPVSSGPDAAGPELQPAGTDDDASCSTSSRRSTGLPLLALVGLFIALRRPRARQD